MQGADEKDPKVLPRHQVLDCVVQNKQGEDLMKFLGKTGMRVVNGRGGRDGFTGVSGRGSSVVDYCIVGVESLGLV